MHKWFSPALQAVALVLIFVFPLESNGLDGIAIKICDDGAEWPPYTYHERIDGKKTNRVIGYSVDVVDAIFENLELEYTVELIPWARCQARVDSGKDYQLALNASYSKERADTYHLLVPYYSMVNYFFYSVKQHPNGLPIQSVEDLKEYAVCGINGYNYATYGLGKGDIDLGAKDFPALISKLHKGRCDLFVEKYEIMAGFTSLGLPFLADPALGRKAIPGMTATPFHMILSRNSKYSEQLKTFIEKRIATLESSGRLRKLLNQYIPEK